MRLECGNVPFFAVLLVAAIAAGQAAPPDLLAQARQRYNTRDYDDAIRLAEEARRNPATANTAAVVLARARLERFRQASEPQDLTAAREALVSIDASKLTPRDHVEYLVGLGEALYLERRRTRFSAAAEFFESALARAEFGRSAEREMIFEWWAGALDRQAQLGLETERKFVYARLLAGAEEERRRFDMSAVARVLARRGGARRRRSRARLGCGTSRLDPRRAARRTWRRAARRSRSARRAGGASGTRQATHAGRRSAPGIGAAQTAVGDLKKTWAGR